MGLARYLVYLVLSTPILRVPLDMVKERFIVLQKVGTELVRWDSKRASKSVF